MRCTKAAPRIVSAAARQRNAFPELEMPRTGHGGRLPTAAPAMTASLALHGSRGAAASDFDARAVANLLLSSEHLRAEASEP